MAAPMIPLHPQMVNPALPIADIRYTSQQITLAKEAGIDTSNWRTDPHFVQKKDNRGSNIFALSWSNPVGFVGNHLRVPYRFKKADYTIDQRNSMAGWLNEMSALLNDCMEFYDDTETEIYPVDYILIRNTNEDGVYDAGCWSQLGFTNPVTYQSMNMALGCIHRSVMQHEMVHALGFLHEQQRLDRDEKVDILWDNIQPSYQFAFDKMPADRWDNYGEIYDLVSVMHYEGTAFLTEEARDAGLSSIVYKGTMNRVVINAPELSSIDIVQLTKRYTDYCVEPTDKVSCNGEDSGEYYLSGKACNGYSDCLNGSDEGFDACGDMGCGTTLLVTGYHRIDGVYVMQMDGYVNSKPYYYNEGNGLYLYSFDGNGNWHFSSDYTAGWATAWTGNHKCPTGQVWQDSQNGNGWEINPGIEVTCQDCVSIPTTTIKPTTTAKHTTTPKPTTPDETTTTPFTPTIPPGALYCALGAPEFGYYWPFQECDGAVTCDNNYDESWEVCADGGCGQVLEVSGSSGFDGFYMIRHSTGLINGKPYYERLEPSPMYLYSTGHLVHWHFHNELNSPNAMAYGRYEYCATDSFYYEYDWSINDWVGNPNFLVQCLDCGVDTSKLHLTQENMPYIYSDQLYLVLSALTCWHKTET